VLQWNPQLAAATPPHRVGWGGQWNWDDPRRLSARGEAGGGVCLKQDAQCIRNLFYGGFLFCCERIRHVTVDIYLA
jgi:hypothetical protein